MINHGKKQYWGVPGTHYHRGMSAGENTLNALVARLLVRSIVEEGAYSPPSFLQSYVTFMTTPGSHNDTYAESYHRIFFANWARGVPPERCSGDDGHNIASAGGLVLLPPAAIAASLQAAGANKGHDESIAAGVEAAVQQMYLTHRSQELEGYVRVYARCCLEVMYGRPLREAMEEAARSVGFANIAKLAGKGTDDRAVIGAGVFSSACYIQHSLPSLFYLAYKYADDPEAALIANTNVGGENCHRGAALGALMGLAHGQKGWPQRWINGLHDREPIAREAEGFGEVAAKLLQPLA